MLSVASCDEWGVTVLASLRRRLHNRTMAKRTPRNKLGSDNPPLPQEGAISSDPPAQATAKNPAAVQLGRLGGLKGGPARARKLTPQQRVEIARKAALSRWAKRRQR